MGRPINKKYFGPLTGSSGTPSGDGYTQAGQTINADTVVATNTVYSEKTKGFNIPVYKARIPGGSLASPTYDMDVGGDASSTPYIIAQKGASKYRVQTSDGVGNCILVNDDGSSAIGPGEMVIAGWLGGDPGNGDPIIIKKISKFYAVDFSGNRYKWHVDNDGSSLANVLTLTAADDVTVN